MGDSRAPAFVAGFKQHLRNFAQENRLLLRLDDDILDVACIDAIEQVCPEITGYFEQIEQTCFYEFRLRRDEVFPSDGEAQRQAALLRDAGFGADTKKRKRSSEVCEAEKEFARFVSISMRSTGALDRVIGEIEKVNNLKTLVEKLQSRLDAFEKANGTAFGVDWCFA